MVARGMMTIRVPHGPINIFSNYVVKILSSISVTFYMYGMLSFPLFFIYRSMILANSTVYGQYFNKRNLLVTFLVIFVFCCVEGACLYYSNIPYEDLFGRLNLTSNALDAFDENVGGRVVAAHSAVDTPPMTTPVYQNVSGVVAMSEENNKRKIPLFGDDYTRNPLILYFHGIAVFSHGVSYIIILISAHFMLNTLKRKQVSMSLDTFLANEVLVHAVFAEAFLPLLLAAPVAANALLTTFYENSLSA
uniref:Aa_trans domain-containing protein n=1 Tax=Heterorhabditis bacteriophora TaxID=37862 RepID=A0A1I7XPI0_HETBA